jgi:hypothetical protein
VNISKIDEPVLSGRPGRVAKMVWAQMRQAQIQCHVLIDFIEQVFILGVNFSEQKLVQVRAYHQVPVQLPRSICALTFSRKHLSLSTR